MTASNRFLAVTYNAALIFAVGVFAGCGKREGSVVTSTANPQASTQPTGLGQKIYPKLDEPGLLAAFRRGAGRVPGHVRIASVQFETIENSAPNYLVKGRLTFELTADTFKEAESLTVEGNTIAILEKVHGAGDSLVVEFSQRIVYDQPESSVECPQPVNWRVLGQPIGNWRRAFERTSPNGQQAIKHAQAYRAADEKIGRMESKFKYALAIVKRVGDDSVDNDPDNWWLELRDWVGYFGYPREGGEANAWYEKYQRSGLRAPLRRKFISDVLDKEVVPEARRLATLYDELIATRRAAVRFFSE